jgi:hypothetical protein
LNSHNVNSYLISDFQAYCADVHIGCNDWLIPPSSNPIIFFPPPSALPLFNLERDVFNYYGDILQQITYDDEIILVTQLSVGGVQVHDRNSLSGVSFSFFHFLLFYSSSIS